jgi:hypothetical protein
MWPNLPRWHKHQFVAQTCVETRSMSCVWQIYYDFLSATTKFAFAKIALASFRQMCVAFVSPKSVAVPGRAQVAQIIVNNNRKQWIAARNRLAQPQVGSFAWLRLVEMLVGFVRPKCAAVASRALAAYDLA